MKNLVTVVVTVVALMAAQAAFAGGSTVLNGYGSSSAKPTIEVKSAVVKESKPAATVVKADTLPFTGTDLGGIAIAGVALVGLGFGLRRVGRDKNKA
ncbi:MAG: hypothetical protein WCJ67_10210 [Thermoleophilia bacterium]